MRRGYIDAITTTGVIEGWASREDRPFDPLLVAVVDENHKELAAGFANLYRDDLAQANYSHGWCHFRLRALRKVEWDTPISLHLLDVQNETVLHSSEKLVPIEASPYEVNNLEDLVTTDPTIFHSLDQIKPMESVFDAYIKARGVDAFVRNASIYVLGRAIDEAGCQLYTRLIRQKVLSSYAVIHILADSVEFRAKPHSLFAPNQCGFPFNLS